MSTRIESPAYLPALTSRRRLWPLRLLGSVVLAAQGFGIYAMVYLFGSKIQAAVDWLVPIPKHLQPSAGLVSGFSFIFLLRPLAVMLLIAALIFAIGRWSGWLISMLAQCFVLFTCLSLYFTETVTPAIYPIMLWSIVMVLFLNSTGVRMLFPAGLRGRR